MSDVVIKVENLSKKYIIGHQKQERYTALRDVISNSARSFWQGLTGSNKSEFNDVSEEFWALKDISFEIKQGDRVGIIGRNGAGKSTLLKILSRITEPTSGKISIKGRVASLLEVGTGFHPELTGRENIYLNGAILGMDRSEIKKKFDEIVAFAEIEKFLDTPVKRYSSGMYVRLAFAVAAHLEPEILIVDEVLAVGDAQFQKKCLGKMDDVSKEGRTVLFVSHNMSSIRSICDTGLLLKLGSLEIVSTIEKVTEFYLKEISDFPFEKELFFSENGNKPQFKAIQLTTNQFNYGDDLDLSINIVSPHKIEVAIEIEIHDEKGVPIVYTSTAPMAGKLLTINPCCDNYYKFKIGPLNLASGDYFIYFWLIKPWAENYHIIKEPLKFTIEVSDPYKSGFEFSQSYGRGATTIPITFFRKKTLPDC